MYLRVGENIRIWEPSHLVNRVKATAATMQSNLVVCGQALLRTSPKDTLTQV